MSRSSLTLAVLAALLLITLGVDSASARVIDVPEIAPSALGGAVALAAGGLAILADRLRRR